MLNNSALFIGLFICKSFHFLSNGQPPIRPWIMCQGLRQFGGWGRCLSKMLTSFDANCYTCHVCDSEGWRITRTPIRVFLFEQEAYISRTSTINYPNTGHFFNYCLVRAFLSLVAKLEHFRIGGERLCGWFMASSCLLGALAWPHRKYYSLVLVATYTVMT